MAGIAACAGLGAVSGSSLATASAMGKVALPELRRYKYSGSLATGSLPEGGTTGREQHKPQAQRLGLSPH